MGRHLVLAILIAGLLALTVMATADNLNMSAQTAPSAATATHAMSATPAPAAGTMAQSTPVKATAVAATVSAPASAAPMTSTPNAVSATPAPVEATSVMPAAPAAATTMAPVQASTGPSMPARGMNMANVEHIFGAPQEKIPAVPDPGTKLNPPITRWVYPDYVVYFEYNYVVHTVLKANPFTDSGHSDG